MELQAILDFFIQEGGAAPVDWAKVSAELSDGELYVKFIIDNLWLLLSAALVFVMHLGFATLESGLTRQKNTVNILFKNTMIICIGILTYAVCGFSLMYPGFEDGASGFFGFAGWGIEPGGPEDMTPAYADYTLWSDFIFQAMFAATAATIVSGAVAERMKLESFLLFSVLFVGFIYPWVGSWHWGEGWLEARGFYDFAGSTLVHSVGGWGALAGAIVLGPRIGKYIDGKINPIPGHNLPLAAIGVFLLWLGWFGFNGGSVLSADPEAVSRVFVTTSLAAAMGGLFAGLTSWVTFKKPDLSMALNGILAGLVGITAGADIATWKESMVIGMICGIVVVFAVLLFDKIKIDDPVGAISVHLVCGILGTLFCGIFNGMLPAAEAPTIGTQLLGIAAYGAVAFPAAFIFFYLLKATVGLRVSSKEELEGLDIHEHGMNAYGDFSTK
jgi:ammonium transporter, Amt family